jgi:hypothetical protein
VLVAHVGHWLVGLLQFVPVVLFIGWIAWSQIRDRRKEKAEAREAATAEPAPEA